MKKILIVEDDLVIRETLERYLERGWQVLTAESLSSAREVYASCDVDVVLLDLRLPDGSGLELLSELTEDPSTRVIISTAYPEVDTAIQALRLGAFDYINKPFDLDELDLVLSRAGEHRRLERVVTGMRRTRARIQMLGASPQMKLLREQIALVAGARGTTALIVGETGVGKELVANEIHEQTPHDGPYVHVDCASLPPTLFEAELFGYERGAFTDAKTTRAGLVEVASGGTLFLDEIGELPLSLQAKLLRLIEMHRFRRIGGNKEREVEIRIVAATNRDLGAMVARHEFRDDLWFRLRVFEVRVPPLRERPGDIPELAESFLRQTARRFGRAVPKLSDTAIDALVQHSWPGNVRELRNVIERAVILVGLAKTVGLDELPSVVPARDSLTPHFVLPDAELPTLAEINQRYARHVFERAGRNKTHAAKILGISRVTLREWLRKATTDSVDEIPDESGEDAPRGSAGSAPSTRLGGG